MYEIVSINVIKTKKALNINNERRNKYCDSFSPILGEVPKLKLRYFNHFAVGNKRM